MPIHALITTVRTRPEPAVFPILDSLYEEFADLVSGCLWVSVLAENDLA